MIVVKSKIKEVAKNCNVAGDFAEALNSVAVDEVKSAKKRAESNSRKTLQAKDVYLGDLNSESMIVVKSKVKDVVKDVNVSGDFAQALNELLILKVSQAALRAEANGRKTLSAKDL